MGINQMSGLICFEDCSISRMCCLGGRSIPGRKSERANEEARRDISGVVTKNMDEDRIGAMDSENQMSIEYTGHGVALS